METSQTSSKKSKLKIDVRDLVQIKIWGHPWAWFFALITIPPSKRGVYMAECSIPELPNLEIWASFAKNKIKNRTVGFLNVGFLNVHLMYIWDTIWLVLVLYWGCFGVSWEAPGKKLLDVFLEVAIGQTFPLPKGLLGLTRGAPRAPGASGTAQIQALMSSFGESVS